MGLHGRVDLPDDLPDDHLRSGDATPAGDAVEPPRPRLDGYRIERLLGAGGSAQVWLGRDGDGDRVALKVLPTEASTREITVLRRLTHPHLVRIRGEAATDDGRAVLVLDYLPGGSLAQLVSSRGGLDPGEVVTVMTPLAEALGALHARGAVHGDVSPANVLFGEDGRPLLCDLGASVVRGVESREQGTDGFTTDAGEGAPADVFGLGGVGWFVLTGRVPPPAAVRPPLAVVCPQAPLALTSLIERCLSADPRRRPSAAEVAMEAFDAQPPAPVRLVAPASIDAAEAVTHRLRRRGDETAEVSLETIMMAATPAAERPARIDRTRLRREPVPPEPRRPRRSIVAAVVVLCGLLAGAGAGAAWMHGREPATVTAGKSPTGPGGPDSTSEATGDAAGSAAADPAAPDRKESTKKGAADGTPNAKDGAAKDSAAKSEGAKDGQQKPTPEPASPSSGAGAGSGATAGGDPDGKEVVAAVQRLSALRAEAFGSGRKANLEKANAPGSPALATDLAAWQRMSDQGLMLRGLTFELRDAELQHADGQAASIKVTTTTGEYDLVRDGSVIQHVAPGEPRSVVLHLVRAEAGWQIQRVE